MLYEIVLKDGNIVTCYGENHDEILHMIVEHDIFVVQENKEVDKVTYILRNNVSFIRFKSDFKGVIKPVV